MRRTRQLLETFKGFWTTPQSTLTKWIVGIGMPASVVAILAFVVRPSVSQETFRITGIAVAIAALILAWAISAYGERPRG